MNRETFRQAVTAVAEARRAAWSVYPLVIEYENREVVDLQVQTDPFFCLQIVYLDGMQASIESSPVHRVYGQLHLAAAVREGQGVAQANTLLEFMFPSFHLRSLGGCRMWGAAPAQKIPRAGWVYYPVLIPFDGDTTP